MRNESVRSTLSHPGKGMSMRTPCFVFLMLAITSSAFSVNVTIRPFYSADKTEESNPALKDLATKYELAITAALVHAKSVTVVERSQIEAVLKEQGFQQSGVTDINSVISAGKILNVNKILSANTSLINGTFSLILKITDVETGRIELVSFFNVTKSSKEAQVKLDFSNLLLAVFETLKIEEAEDLRKSISEQKSGLANMKPVVPIKIKLTKSFWNSSRFFECKNLSDTTFDLYYEISYRDGRLTKNTLKAYAKGTFFDNQISLYTGDKITFSAQNFSDTVVEIP